MVWEPAIDWSACDLVESVSGKMSGRPVIKGTRVPPETIVGDFLLGSPLDEITENYPTVTQQEIEGILRYALECGYREAA